MGTCIFRAIFLTTRGQENSHAQEGAGRTVPSLAVTRRDEEPGKTLGMWSYEAES